MMAWRLAQERTFAPRYTGNAPYPRADTVAMPSTMPDVEYYRIVDDAQIGFYDTPMGMTCYL